MALSSGFGLRRPSCNRGITERRTEVVGIFPERDVHPPGSSVHPAGAERRVGGAASSRHDPRDPHGVLEPPAFHLPAVAARAPWPRPAHTVRSRSHTTSWDTIVGDRWSRAKDPAWLRLQGFRIAARRTIWRALRGDRAKKLSRACRQPSVTMRWPCFSGRPPCASRQALSAEPGGADAITPAITPPTVRCEIPARRHAGAVPRPAGRARRGGRS